MLDILRELSNRHAKHERQDSQPGAAQTALKLLGNTRCHLAMERRKNALSDMNPNLKDTAEEDSLYKEAAPNFFFWRWVLEKGKRDDELKAPRSTRQAPKKTTSNNWKGKDHQFFQGRCPFTQGRRSVQRPQQTLRHRPYPSRGKAQINPQNNQN